MAAVAGLVKHNQGPQIVLAAVAHRVVVVGVLIQMQILPDEGVLGYMAKVTVVQQGYQQLKQRQAEAVPELHQLINMAETE